MLAAAAAIYLPLRGVSLSVKVGLGFEVASLIAIFIIIIASYVTYGAHFDTAQWSLTHLTSSTTFIAAVTAVGGYAGFESAASLGLEARDAHRNVPRAILRLVIALSVLYLISTYPEVLGFTGPHGSLGPDSTPLPVVAANAGVSWTSYVIDITLGVAMIVSPQPGARPVRDGQPGGPAAVGRLRGHCLQLRLPARLPLRGHRHPAVAAAHTGADPRDMSWCRCWPRRASAT